MKQDGKQLPKPASPAPDAARLHQAALRHLSRFAATEAGLTRVLERSVLRWARQVTAEGGTPDTAAPLAEAAVVARRLTEAGMVDDAAFAAARAARLARGGRSRRAAAAHLVGKGIDPALAEAALPVEELPAAVVFARKRRIGPFRLDGDAETRQRDLAAFARAGFGREVAERALALPADEAEALLLAARRGP